MSGVRLSSGRVSTTLSLGPAGYLDLKDAPDKRQHFDFGDNDPARLRDNLRINDLAEELFPCILTGVRFWPFLLVARDLEERYGDKPSDNKVISELRRIATTQRRNRGIGSRTRLGPRTINSFRPYKGMLRLIRERSKKSHQAKNLAKFLMDRRSHYRGDLSFFEKNEKKWKRVLKSSLGPPGKDFAKLIKNNKVSDLWDAIDEILAKPGRFHKKLVEGAAAYALLVCLYGIMEEGQVYHEEDSQKRARLLLKLIDKRPKLPVAQYQLFIMQAANSSKPPFARINQKAKEQGRRVLAGLRFGTFWNLYRRPSPSVLE